MAANKVAKLKKVRMKTRYAGPMGVHQPGAEVSFDAKTAKDMVAGRYAEYVDEPKRTPAKITSAKITSAETASNPPDGETADVKIEGEGHARKSALDGEHNRKGDIG